MSINEKDLKKLWALSAGRCSRPGCDQECIVLVDSDLVVVGEMAHIVAKKPMGPRGISTGGEDTYENLILLCPTHHTEIDKSPEGAYPPEILFEWKKVHEAAVAASLKSPSFASRIELCEYIRKLLTENKTTWATYGPESEAAKKNPYSNIHKMWPFRKLSTVIPNNRKIINAVRKNSQFFDSAQYEIVVSFIEHAEGFEKSAYEKLENVPRFPNAFEEVIHDCSKP
jgi:hypothetical protein